MTTETIPIDTTALEAQREEVEALVTLLPEREITTSREYEEAGHDLTTIKRRRRELDEMRKAMTRPLDESKARIMELFRPVIAELDHAEAKVKQSMLLYQREQDRIAAERRREAERERAEKEAAAMRAAEEGRLADALRVQQERDAIRDPEPDYERAPGTSTQTRWSAEVTDLADLVLAVAEGNAPLNLLQANTQALNALARATKGDSPIPGVKFVSKTTLAASSR